MKIKTEENLFILGMRWRIIYGFLRIILGLALLKVIGMPVLDVIKSLMQHELIQDPNDLLYTLATDILTIHPFYVTYFLSSYYIFWGVIDVVLSYNLAKHHLWAFPISLSLIGLFVLYEIRRFTDTHSLILLSVIIVDLFILWITSHEYRNLLAFKKL